MRCLLESASHATFNPYDDACAIAIAHVAQYKVRTSAEKLSLSFAEMHMSEPRPVESSDCTSRSHTHDGARLHI
jgi:hypothetical protein